LAELAQIDLVNFVLETDPDWDDYFRQELFDLEKILLLDFVELKLH
jgi:hypothetical protein